MQSHVSLPSAVGQANAADAQLQPFLRMDTSNPLFNSSGAEQQAQYQNKFFDLAFKPALAQQATQEWLGGNLGTNGESTFGANRLGSLEAQGRSQSFLEGQNYYNNLLNNFLNTRNNFFGNEVLPSMQADMFNQEQNQQGLGMLNQYRLGQAGGLTNSAGAAMGFAQNQQDRQLAASAATARNQSNLLTGMGGLLGGGIGMLMNRKSGGGNGLFGGGGGSSYLGYGNSPFGSSSFANSLGVNY